MQPTVKKKCKTKHDWVGNVIHWDLCKWLKFDHIDKLYMHKPESVQKMGPRKFSGILEEKQITQSRPEE